MTGQIAIIGLGQIGASIGMALKQANSPLRRVGFDKDGAVARAAESLSASRLGRAAPRLPLRPAAGPGLDSAAPAVPEHTDLRRALHQPLSRRGPDPC